MVADNETGASADSGLTLTERPTEQPTTEDISPEANGLLQERLEIRLAMLKQQVAKRKDAEEALRREGAKLASHARHLAALNKMGQTVTATLDVEIVFERVLTTLRSLLNAEGVFILLREGEDLVFVASDEAGEGSVQGMRIPADASVAGEVIRTGRSLWVNGEEMKRRISPRFEEAIGYHLRAMLAAPLRLKDELTGIIEAVHSHPDAFDADDLQLLEAAASWVAIAMHNAQLYAQVQTSRQRLGRLARKVITAQEEERLRVSRELHDEAGQALIALKLDLEAIRASLPVELESTRQGLDEAISLTDETMDEMRILAHNLRPPVVEALGLNSALEGLCSDFARRTQLSIQYEDLDLPQLPDPVAISYYRFLQEALTNVAKHAGASQVQVVLGRTEDTLYLSVNDNGDGFSVDEKSNPARGAGGVGLTGMQERFEMLGGWVIIDSGTGKGTHVTAYVPIEAES
jgi:signal transduction histidine kinase